MSWISSITTQDAHSSNFFSIIISLKVGLRIFRTENCQYSCGSMYHRLSSEIRDRYRNRPAWDIGYPFSETITILRMLKRKVAFALTYLPWSTPRPLRFLNKIHCWNRTKPSLWVWNLVGLYFQKSPIVYRRRTVSDVLLSIISQNKAFDLCYRTASFILPTLYFLPGFLFKFNKF